MNAPTNRTDAQPTDTTNTTTRREALAGMLGMAAVPMLPVPMLPIPSGPTPDTSSQPSETSTGPLARSYQLHLDAREQFEKSRNADRKEFSDLTGFHWSKIDNFVKLYGTSDPRVQKYYDFDSATAKARTACVKTYIAFVSKILDAAGLTAEQLDFNAKTAVFAPAAFVLEGSTLYQLVRNRDSEPWGCDHCFVVEDLYYGMVPKIIDLASLQSPLV